MIDPLVIILAAPYTHASLVCAMLGQHPEMYALPDTNLFIADDVEAVLDAHARIGHGVGDGLLRLFAQINEGGQDDDTVKAAAAWLRARGNWTTRQLLDYVYEKLNPRYLVDSSPSTVISADNLQRMRRMYPDANFIHLASHPRRAADAFADNHASRDALFALFDGDPDSESVWYGPNSLVAEFAMSLPAGQCLRLMVEDLLQDPENYLLQIAQWLDLTTGRDAISAMLHPEKMPYAATGPSSAPGGMETGFLEHPGLPAKIAPASLAASASSAAHEFSPELLKLAKEFGYR